jgi:hypothetical protein
MGVAGSRLPPLGRGWCVGLALALALAAFPSAAVAVPGGPVPENEASLGAWLRNLPGAIPRPKGGNYGTLNTSGVHSASANQVNDPSLDRVQSFPGGPPTVTATESETSVAASGENVVVGYNSTAGVVFTDAFGGFSQELFDGYSVSHDDGRTWRSGFIPAEPGAPLPFTLGDPSLAGDRAGNFYYASLSWFGIQVSRSTDGGDTWMTTNVAPAYVSDSDQPDKPWLAVGPDPKVPSRDDLYVTWDQLVDGGASVMFSRSTDGGATWSPARVVFQPVASGVMSPYAGPSNPVVDASTGRLYIPFLHYSNSDADDVRVLISDDAGQTFRLVRFNVAGAPDANAFPNVTPGSFTDCGIYGGGRLTLHQGTATPGPYGPRWVQATRITTQPAAAAVNGRLFIAVNSSTSPTYGAGTGSEIRLLYSPDGGTTWNRPVTVAPSTSTAPQHVLPAIMVDPSGSRVRIVDYVQAASGRIGVDSQTGTIGANGVSFAKPTQIASPFDLPPTNITISPTVTASYDVTAPCYALGEYLGAAPESNGPIAAWGADRQLWKEPPGAIISGVHAQQDVFFGALR